MIDNAELIRRAKQIQVRVQDRSPKVTVREIAEILDISPTAALSTMWKLQKEGILKYVARGSERGDWYWIGVK